MLTSLKVVARSFLRTPGFTATALVILALCLGANLTIFAVIDSVLLRPLPFPAANALVTVFNTYPNAGVERDGSSIANYYERRRTLSAFSHLSLIRHGSAIIGNAGSTERTDVIRVTPEFFATVGAGPVMGRSFTEEETTYQTNDVAIISDSYWRERLNGDANVVGRTIRVDGAPKTIVGVLPPEFRFLSSNARLFLPLASDPAQRGPNERHSGSGSDMIARLAPGVSIIQGQAQIDAQNVLLERNNPQAKSMADAGFHSLVVSLHADHVASIRPILLLLQAGVLLLMIIGSINLVNLLLMRASGRTKELAIRQSMGASRRHITVQVLTETLLLTVAGGVLGLVVGAGGIRLLSVLGVNQLPLGAHIAFGWSVALTTLATVTILGAVLALPIVWFNLRGHLANALKSESRGGTGSRSVQRLRHGFIVAQISLAFVLLAGSGLLGLSLRRAMSVSPGFRPDHVLTGRISLPGTNYGSVAALVAFTDQLMETVRRQPGVVAVGVITNIPLSGNSGKSAITPRGRVMQPGESLQGHYSYGVTGDYFAALGIPLREGRFLTLADERSGARLCVVDEDFARRYWPAGSAIGQQVFQAGAPLDGDQAFTIVGVVGAVKQADVTERQLQGAAYFPFVHRADANVFVVTRTSQRPESMAATVERLVRGIDPELPIDGLRSMETRIADSLVSRRSPALLIGIFAAVALLLAAVGTYGVLAYAVTQRRREIGVRLALGALPKQIGNDFLSLGLQLLAAGTLLGVIGTWMAGRFMRSMLFDVPSLHLATLIGSAVIMSAVSLLACYVPARRASKVDPLIALAAE